MIWGYHYFRKHPYIYICICMYIDYVYNIYICCFLQTVGESRSFDQAILLKFYLLLCYFVDIRLVTLTGLLAYFYVYINIYQYTVFMHVYNVWIYIYVKYVYIYIYIHTCAYYVYHRFVWTIGDTFSVTPGVALFVTGLILGCFSTGQPNGPADGPDEHAKNTLPKFNMVHLKMAPRKRRFLLETIIFRFHVKLGECRVFILQLLLATSICHCKSTERRLLFLKNAEGGISHSISKIKELSHFWGIFMFFSFGWYLPNV